MILSQHSPNTTRHWKESKSRTGFCTVPVETDKRVPLATSKPDSKHQSAGQKRITQGCYTKRGNCFLPRPAVCVVQVPLESLHLYLWRFGVASPISTAPASHGDGIKQMLYPPEARWCQTASRKKLACIGKVVGCATVVRFGAHVVKATKNRDVWLDRYVQHRREGQEYNRR